jgi:hypothetical protein
MYFRGSCWVAWVDTCTHVDRYALQRSGFLHISELKRTIYKFLFPVTIHGRTVQILEYNAHLAGVIAIVNADIPITSNMNEDMRNFGWYVM